MSQTAPAAPHSATLRQSEERFRLLVEGVKDYAIFMLDPQGHVLTWNAGAERLKGYSAAEIIGQHFSRFYPPETLKAGLPARELEVAQATGTFEDEGWRVRKDGTLFWANVVVTALRDRSGTLLGFAKVTRDLTQRRDHEESLRQSEERFRLLVEGVSDYAIFMLDVNGVVASWNAGAQRIKGYAANEIIGRHFSTFYPADARQSGWPEHELQVAAETGRFFDEGWRIRQDGTSFWAAVTITALRDSQARLIGFAKLTRDLTGQKRAEALEIAGQQREEILEAERSARMEAQRATRIKDEFLATLSHELRTPLSSILGWTQVLKLKADALKPADLKRAVDVIDRNARAQVRLIEDLLDLNRIMAGKVRLDVKQVSLPEIVQSVIESAEPGAKAKDIRLEARLDPDTPLVPGDSDRLQQVVWNLLSNAIKFTARGGRIEVVLQRAGASTVLSVSDTGIGIPGSLSSPRLRPLLAERRLDVAQLRRPRPRPGDLETAGRAARRNDPRHSPGEGRGATFFVELPLAAVPARGDAAPAEPPTADASRPREPRAAQAGRRARLRRRRRGGRARAAAPRPRGPVGDRHGAVIGRGGAQRIATGQAPPHRQRHRHAGDGRLPAHADFARRRGEGRKNPCRRADRLRSRRRPQARTAGGIPGAPGEAVRRRRAGARRRRSGEALSPVGR